MLIRTAIASGPAAPEPYTVTQLLGEGEAGATGSVTVEVLASGATSPPQPTAAETVSFLLGGCLSDDGADKPLLAGDAMFHPAGCLRSFRNIGSEPASLFVVRSKTTEGCSGAEIGAVAQRVSLEVADDPQLDRASGFISMGVRWLATRDTIGTCNVTLGTSTFEPGGQHDRHRHPHALEFLLVVSGGGMHLTQDGATPLTYGQLVLIGAGEWHGFRTDPGVTTRTVFGYLGAASLSEAGYELLPDDDATNAIANS
jgi:quercetin dioxygenase-like cupin family protein